MSPRFAAAVLVLLGCVTWARADADSKPADSPKQALVAQDAAAKAGDLDQDMSFYKADSDQQQKLARAMAEGDLAEAKLEKVVETKFGKELAAAAVRAAGTEDVEAVDAATEKVEGDRATVKLKDQPQLITMVNVDGKWKISLTDWLKGLNPADVDRLTQAIKKFTDGIRHVTDLVEHDKFRSGEGVRDRVQELHDRLFGAQ